MVHVAMVHVAMVHVAMVHVAMVHVAMVHNMVDIVMVLDSTTAKKGFGKAAKNPQLQPTPVV